MTSVCMLALVLIFASASAVEVPPGLGLALPVAAVVPEIKPYDCEAEADIWEWAWTPDWKAWCCAHESKGCPSTSTVTTTTPLTSSTKTLTETSTVTSTATHTQTSTEDASTVTHTETRTGTRTMTTTAMPATHAALQTTPGTQKPAESPEPRWQATAQPSTEATTKRLTQVATAPTTSLSTSSQPAVVASEPNDGCNSECIILGESATCQSRISWVEEHQTQGESAPCPAAHVVVMSQCESCGACMFKDVKCASSAGVSKSLGEHTFMYRKYLEEPSGVVDGGAPTRQRDLSWLLSIGIVPLVAMGVVSRRRCRSDSHSGREEEWGVDASVLAAE